MPDASCCVLATPLVNLFNGLVSPCIGEAYAPYTYDAQKESLEQLKEKVEDVKKKLDELEKQDNGVNVFKKDPRTWKKEVKDNIERVEKKIKKLKKSIEAACPSGCLPNRQRRSAAKRSIQEEYEKFDELLNSYTPVVKGQLRPPSEIVRRTRSEEIEKIWQLLGQENEVKVVCIHGVALVGKTAIAEAICNKALLDENETFDYVIWVEAEFESQLKSLQEKIMKALNDDVTDKVDDEERPSKIREEFVRRRKCLIIIDFVWESFTLREIGIPEEVEVEGMICKVILTTRSKTTCPKTRKVENFEIKPLSEGWTFFLSNIDWSVASLDGEVEDMVKKAVEYCEGLPQEIINLGNMIKNLMQDHSSSKIVSSLKEILSSQTRNEPLTDTKSLDRWELSYKSLKFATYQKCFLHCALYPKHDPIEVEELIDNWIWEGFLDKCRGTLEVKRNFGSDVLNKLITARLLEKAESNGGKDRVKMLSLCHDMVMNVMYKESSNDFIKSGKGEQDFPLDGNNEEIERASFMNNKFGALSNQPNCPNLTTLILQNNPIKFISYNFFSKMPKLKILDLSYTDIYKLPSSIGHLKLLQVLRLRHCSFLSYLPCLSNLVELVVLDLFGTPLEILPPGMENLKKLKCLNLSHTKLTKLQIGLVSALESLQELLMLIDHAEAYSWRSKEYVEELACLESLRVVQLNFYNNDAFDKYMQAIPSTRPRPRAPQFKFCIGGFITHGNLGDNSIAFIGSYPDYNQLLPEGTLELHMSACSRNLTPNNTIQNFGIIFDKLKVLGLSNCSGFTYLLSFNMLHSLQNLERIYVRDCSSFLGIIEPTPNAMQSVSFCRLLKLQQLVLMDLENLESICPGQAILAWPAFQSISVWNCDKLESLPIIVSKVKKIKLKGKNLNLKFDDLSRFELEAIEIPDKIVTFVRAHESDLPESPQKPMANVDQAIIFKSRSTEKTRVATILSENEGNVSPPQSPGFLVRRVDAAKSLFRILQRGIRVLFV